MKSLLIIDDTKIRQGAFDQAEKWVKKIDELELKLGLFEAQDQQLFSNWFDLTFRDKKKQIADLQAEYQHLSKYHNWLVALTRLHGLDLYQAILFLRDEEDLLKDGSDEDKTRVLHDREQRDLFIQKEIEQELGYDGLGEDDYGAEDEARDADPRDDQDDDKLAAIRELSDDRIKKICRDYGDAHVLLAAILDLSRRGDGHALLIRVWDLTPKKNQQLFAKEFKRQTGLSFDLIIEEFRETLEDDFSIDGEGPGAAGDTDDEDLQREFHQSINGKARGQAAPKPAGEELEALKLLYRQLVRRLHPDLQGDRLEMSPWQKQIWGRVQSANQKQDRRELEKLLRVVLIRNRELGSLTISELLESQAWFKEEWTQMNAQTRDLKNQPAWGFSLRKDYGSLKKKLEKSLALEQEQAEDQLRELQVQYERLEAMAKARSKSGKAPRQRKKTTRRAARRPRRRKSEGASPEWGSLFD